MGGRRRGLSYANVTATLALVLAASGSALAATHYLINSTAQISPKVLKQLEGRQGAQGLRGRTGPAGLAGPAGARGQAGPEGARGERGERGPAGETRATKGERGEQGPQGEKGEPGPRGERGEAGSALAYAYITEKGAVPESKNFEGAVVEELGGEGGVFCISGLAFTPHNVTATLVAEEAARLGGVRASVGALAAEEAGCKAGTQITVETYEPFLIRTDHGLQIEEAFAGQGFYIAVN